MKNWILIMLVIVLAVVPLFLAKGAEFGGADAQAEAAISKNPTGLPTPGSRRFSNPPVEKLKVCYLHSRLPLDRVSSPIFLVTRLG